MLQRNKQVPILDLKHARAAQLGQVDRRAEEGFESDLWGLASRAALKLAFNSSRLFTNGTDLFHGCQRCSKRNFRGAIFGTIWG